MDPLLSSSRQQFYASPLQGRRLADPSPKLTLPGVQHNSPLKGTAHGKKLYNFNAGLTSADGPNDYLVSSKPIFPMNSSHPNPLPHFFAAPLDVKPVDARPVISPSKTMKRVSFQKEEIGAKKPLKTILKQSVINAPDNAETIAASEGLSSVRDKREHTGPKLKQPKQSKNDPPSFTEALKVAKTDSTSNKSEQDETTPRLKEEKERHRIKIKKRIPVGSDAGSNSEKTTSSVQSGTKINRRLEATIKTIFLKQRENSEESSAFSSAAETERPRERTLRKLHTTIGTQLKSSYPDLNFSNPDSERDPLAKAIMAHLKPGCEVLKEYYLDLPQAYVANQNIMTGNPSLLITKHASLPPFLNYGEDVQRVELLGPTRNLPLITSQFGRKDLMREDLGTRNYAPPLNSFRDMRTIQEERGSSRRLASFEDRYYTQVPSYYNEYRLDYLS